MITEARKNFKNKVDLKISTILKTRQIYAGDLFFQLKPTKDEWSPYIPIKRQFTISIGKKPGLLRTNRFVCYLEDIDKLIEFLKDIKNVIEHFEENEQETKEELQRQNAITDDAYKPFEVKNAQETQEI